MPSGGDPWRGVGHCVSPAGPEAISSPPLPNPLGDPTAPLRRCLAPPGNLPVKSIRFSCPSPDTTCRPLLRLHRWEGHRAAVERVSEGG